MTLVHARTGNLVLGKSRTRGRNCLRILSCLIIHEELQSKAYWH